jgi:aminopeptidase N
MGDSYNAPHGPLTTGSAPARPPTHPSNRPLSMPSSLRRLALSLAAPASVALLALPAPALTAPLGAQSNAERIANDHFTRSHDYDLVHQRIELRDFNWDSTSFAGRVTTTLVALRPAMDSVILDAGALLRVTAARDAAGTALATQPYGDTLVVRLPRPAAFGDTVRFTLDYQGRVRNGRGLTFLRPEGRPHRPLQLWSQGEAQNNHDWFPTYDFPNDKMTWELLATVPDSLTAISNGRLVSDRRNRDHTRTLHWSQERPSATYLVSLIVGPYAKVHDTWRDIPVDYYVYREDTALARALFRVTPDMMETYSRLTGVPYPWAKYAQTTVADFFGGMENVSATTLVDWLPDARAYLDRPWYQYILIPHELAHQWFGDYVTTSNWANMWLNEGFAEFMPGAYWQAKLGAHAAEDYYLDEYRQFMSIDDGRRMPLASPGSNNIYPKGALVLRMLERYLGEERFWASVHTYLTTHALGSATSDDLRQAVLAATGENLDWFWDQWVYQAGYPAFSIKTTYDSTARRLTLIVAQTQTDSGRADTAAHFATPQVFRMPVTIRVGTPRGDLVQHAWVDARTDTIAVGPLPGAPSMVVFDDGNTILKRLDFDQPTSWLATQLRRDPDLWNRAWVISQLARRSTDTVAARALADAATGADYYLTRAQAAGALAAFPHGVAAPALEAAMRDTSAQVRHAAVLALGAVGGDRALALARTAFASDSSYNVQAAALATIARLDGAPGRRAALGQALAKPSYRDAIQGVALDVIARTGDTTFLAQVESLTTTQPRAVYTLATLAARGHKPALDRLMAQLNDRRAYLREWTVQAFQRRMTPAMARAHLESVASSLAYADTRREVDALVAAETGR